MVEAKLDKNDDRLENRFFVLILQKYELFNPDLFPTLYSLCHIY